MFANHDGFIIPLAMISWHNMYILLHLRIAEGPRDVQYRNGSEKYTSLVIVDLNSYIKESS